METNVDIILASYRILSNNIPFVQIENYFYENVFFIIKKYLIDEYRKKMRMQKDYDIEAFQSDLLLAILNICSIPEQNHSNQVYSICQKIIHIYENKCSEDYTYFIKFFLLSVKRALHSIWKEAEPDKEKIIIRKNFKKVVKNSKIIYYDNKNQKNFNKFTEIYLLDIKDTQLLQFNELKKNLPTILSKCKVNSKRDKENLDIRNIITGGLKQLENLVVNILEICACRLQFNQLLNIILEIIRGYYKPNIDSLNQPVSDDEDSAELIDVLDSEDLKVENYESEYFFNEQVEAIFLNYKNQVLNNYSTKFKITLLYCLKNNDILIDSKKINVNDLISIIDRKKSSIYTYIDNIKMDLKEFLVKEGSLVKNQNYDLDKIIIFLIKIKKYLENQEKVSL